MPSCSGHVEGRRALHIKLDENLVQKRIASYAGLARSNNLVCSAQARTTFQRWGPKQSNLSREERLPKLPKHEHLADLASSLELPVCQAGALEPSAGEVLIDSALTSCNTSTCIVARCGKAIHCILHCFTLFLFILYCVDLCYFFFIVLWYCRSLWCRCLSNIIHTDITFVYTIIYCGCPCSEAGFVC